MQRVFRAGRRVLKPATVALASALAIGGVRRSRQKSYGEATNLTPASQPSGGGQRGFVATFEDKSNDRGFVASIEDGSNDTGFHQPVPVRIPEADQGPTDIATATDAAHSHVAPHKLGDPPPDS